MDAIERREPARSIALAVVGVSPDQRYYPTNDRPAQK